LVKISHGVYPALISRRKPRVRFVLTEPLPVWYEETETPFAVRNPTEQDRIKAV
jgi:hypothetical protein